MIQNPAEGSEGMVNLLDVLSQTVFKEDPPSGWESALRLLVVIAVSTAVGMWLLRRKEIFK